MTDFELVQWLRLKHRNNDFKPVVAHLRAMAGLGFPPLDIFVYVATIIANDNRKDFVHWCQIVAYRVCTELIGERQEMDTKRTEHAARHLDQLRNLFDEIGG